MSTDRRQARILAMQAICHWDAQRDATPGTVGDFLEEQEAAEPTRRFALELVEQFLSRQNEIDEALGQAATNWSLERMTLVERNLLRTAATELMMGATPSKVVMNEAIEIGREFGGAETPAFVNGILDSVARSMAGRHGAKNGVV